MERTLNYINEVLTGKTGIVGSAGAVLGTLFTWSFGEWEIGLKALFWCMTLDYAMGLVCGKKENNLSSQIGFDGLKKKFTILIILMLAVILDRLLGQGWVFRTLVIYFYVGIEGLSILENAARLNAPIPETLKNALIQLKEGNKKGLKKD
jgi:toxin secretion/phage lysis holin